MCLCRFYHHHGRLDPAEAPLDPWCRSFDHPNLWVVDASCLPTSAAVNPCLTVAAQALRAGDRWLRETGSAPGPSSSPGLR